MRRRLALAASTLVVLAGCSGGSAPLAPAQDKQLRNNFSRALTPEEIAQMGGASKGATAPNKK